MATPDFIASEARKMSRQTGMKCTVIKGAKLLDEKLVGIHTVGQASENAPCLVRIEYAPPRVRRGTKPVVLVGKTITDALALRGFYRLSGKFGRELESRLKNLSPEIYGSMNDPRIVELKGLEYVLDRLPRALSGPSLSTTGS